jgi:hypothetical protein
MFTILIIRHCYKTKDIQFILFFEYQIFRLVLSLQVAWYCFIIVTIISQGSFEYHYSYCHDFSVDQPSLDGLTYDFGDFVTPIIFNLIPTAYAEESGVELVKHHPSFSTIDTTNGGKLIQAILDNLVAQLGDHLPIYLTPTGINSASILSPMLNALETSSHEGDRVLFSYLCDSVTSSYNLHFDINLASIVPNKAYTLPLGTQKVPQAHGSGVYGFFFNDELGLGSAVSCRARLVDHMASFYNHRDQNYMHKFVMSHGGIENLTWSPLITSTNLVHDWNVSHSTTQLSLGGHKTLLGFTQFPLRVLEQGMMDKYTPSLNPYAGQIGYFNFGLSLDDFNMPLGASRNYQAFDETMTNVLAEADSFNKMSKLVGLSNVSVRNNMDWHLGVDMTIKGQEVHGYLREVGKPLRMEAITSQLVPKSKFPTLELVDRTLYDLIPGKLHAVTVDSFTDFGCYDNERDLWTSLNPTTADKVNSMRGAQVKQYLNNRVGRYMNVARPEGNPTEMGHFHFCRHPDFLAGLAKVAEAIMAVNIVTGVCTYYSNISKVSPNRTTIRNHLYKGSVHNDTTRYFFHGDFLKYYPEAEGLDTFTLSKEQIVTLDDIKPRTK